MPTSIKRIPTKKNEVRFHDMAACGTNNENKKSIAIPVHHKIAMRLSEP